MTNDKNSGADKIVGSSDVLERCPFCGKAPETYVIGERVAFGEHGQRMVRCKNGACGLWYHPMSLDKWQKRSNA